MWKCKTEPLFPFRKVVPEEEGSRKWEARVMMKTARENKYI